MRNFKEVCHEIFRLRKTARNLEALLNEEVEGALTKIFGKKLFSVGRNTQDGWYEGCEGANIINFNFKIYMKNKKGKKIKLKNIKDDIIIYHPYNRPKEARYMLDEVLRKYIPQNLRVNTKAFMVSSDKRKLEKALREALK